MTDGDARGELARLAGEDEYAAMGHERWISRRPCTSSSASARRATTSATGRPTSCVDGEEIGWPAPYWYVDAGALFMLLQLAALDEGLVAGVFGVAAEQVPELKAAVGMPDDVHFVCVVTIGHPSPAGDDEAVTSRLSRRRCRWTSSSDRV